MVVSLIVCAVVGGSGVISIRSASRVSNVAPHNRSPLPMHPINQRGCKTKVAKLRTVSGFNLAVNTLK